VSHPSPNMLALDFDGVICDGLIEYFQTTKRTYEKIWKADKKPVSDEIESTFHRLRTVIETGWEMPILLRALILGIAEEKILQNWLTVANQIVESEGLDKKEISKQLDTVRDEWIASDLKSWLALHRFYPGVIPKIRKILASATKFYIITTKEGRFVKQLLEQQKIDLPENTIFGKEYKRPKYETLREILKIYSENPENLWFVEDRLEALELVRQQDDLQAVKLYLADWGYNTQQTRDSLRDRQDIKLLSLERFEQDCSSWD
jgi:phosphoglycolate phosphatase-like HAD superfamily hydrolase